MEINSDVEPKREGFRRRQFSDDSTWSQAIFDFIFGIFAPILCLYFDPVLFYNRVPCSNMSPPLAPYRIFIYTAVGLGMIILAVWLVLRHKITRGLGLIAGVFFTGTALAVTIGIVLLPTSFMGLLICLGLLGFIPFLTAYVYFRNGLHALTRARQQNPSRSITELIASILTGALLIFYLSALLQWQSPSLFPQWQNEPQYVDSCAGQ